VRLISTFPAMSRFSVRALTQIFSNLAISLETFFLIVLHGRPSYTRCFLVIGIIWLYVTILEVVALLKTYNIGEGEKPFLGDTGLCKFLILVPCGVVLSVGCNRLGTLMCASGCSTTSVPGHLAKYVTYWLAAAISIAAYGSIAWTLKRRTCETEQGNVAHLML
jgi:hypothetical protein